LQLALLYFLEDIKEPLFDGVCFLLRHNALRSEHSNVGDAALNVLGCQTSIKGDGSIETGEQRIHGCSEPSLPDT